MRKSLISLVSVLVLLGGASPALASGRDVIDDCTDDEVLTKTYTQKEYRDALAKLPADADQYGNCRDIIARAQDAAVTKGSKGASKNTPDDDAVATGTSGNGTPGSGTPATPATNPAKEQLAAASPEDRAAADAAARDASDTAIAPTAAESAGTDAGTSLAELPAPILALLACMLAGSLGLGAVRIRRLVHARGA